MADVTQTPRRLIWTNILFGFSGAGFLISLASTHGVQMLGAAVFYSIMLLQFYRLVLLLLTMGAKEAWSGMRRWKVKHWTTDQHHEEPDHDAG